MKKSKLWESICWLTRCYFFLNDSQTTKEKTLSKLGWLLLQPDQLRPHCPKGYIRLQYTVENLNPDVGLYNDVFTQSSATAFVLKPTHRFWSGTTPIVLVDLWFVSGILDCWLQIWLLTPWPHTCLWKKPPLSSRSKKAHSWAQNFTWKFVTRWRASALFRAIFRQVCACLSCFIPFRLLQIFWSCRLSLLVCSRYFFVQKNLIFMIQLGILCCFTLDIPSHFIFLRMSGNVFWSLLDFVQRPVPM